MIFLNKILLSFFFLLFTSTAVTAAISPELIFSEEVLAYDEYGKPLPAVTINPEDYHGIKKYQFPLSSSNFLEIETNITNPASRGLSQVVDTVQRCYHFIENKTGRKLHENILIYLVELDYIPQYYRFRAQYSDKDEQWGEVRLALVEKGDMLYGPSAPDSLNELLFDTLPHELGHDLLADIPNLSHDIEGKLSNHTRWFTEGVCELLAKTFSRQESTLLWKKYLRRRNVDSVLASQNIRKQIFSWSQENSNSMFLESDLYGASYLLLLKWTENIPLRDLLHELAQQRKPLDGKDLKKRMIFSTGLSVDQLFDHAQVLGLRLARTYATSLQDMS